MGTTFLVKFVEASRPPTHQARETIEAEIHRRLQRINEQMSTYLPDSELSRFNRCAQTNWFSVSPEVAEVFQRARSLSEFSNGAFDITVGPLVNLWGFGAEKRPWQVPDSGAVTRLLPSVGFRKVSVRQNPPSLRKAVPELQCDLSAIAKGYGVDQLAEYLESIRVKNYLVQIGGEVRAGGRNQAGQPWRVVIQDPKNPEDVKRFVVLRNRAISTSGDYVQFFEQGGKRYSHIIDPRTGKPVAQNVASVTVVHRSSALADGWATALNVLGPDEGFKLALRRKLPVLMILRTPDGFVEKMTPAFKNLIAVTTSP